jgi:cytochrome c biogenesis protein CcdA
MWIAPLSAMVVLLVLSSALVFFANVKSSPGTSAPSFAVKDIDGGTISSADLKGKVVVLHMAVVYCGGVITDQGLDQIRHLRAAKVSTGQDVAYLTVTSENCPTTDLLTLRQHLNITWSVVNDWPDMVIFGPYAEYFSKHGDPTLIIIDPTGKVVKHSGLLGSDDIVKAVDGARAGSISQDPFSIGISYAGMFGLGAATSLAPCSIALLATMLAFLISRKGEKAKKHHKDERPPVLNGLSIGLFFTLGTGLVFLCIGLLVGSINLLVVLSPIFFIIAGTVLIVLGLNSVFSLFDHIGAALGLGSGGGGASSRWAKLIQITWRRSQDAGAFLLGVLFSLAWAPCAISLVLPVIVLMIASKVGLLSGGALLYFFGLGHAVLIIPIAMVTETSRVKIAKRYMKVGKTISVIFGIVVAVMGILFVLRGFGIFLW